MRRAIIIGAGVAGMAAAEQLCAGGWRVMVLEQDPQPDGRCASRRLDADHEGAWFDYGAQYFTVRAPPAFSAQITADLAAGHLSRWQPTLCVAERSGGGWRLSRSPDRRERLIGPHGLARWVRHRLATCDVKLRCETPVRAIEHSSAGWRIRLAGRRTPAPAAAVVVTAPAAQAAALLGTAAKRIPVLATVDWAMHACHALVVKAPPCAAGHGIFVRDGALSWIADNSHKAGANAAPRHIWTLHAGPAFSDAHRHATPAETTPPLLAEFAADPDGHCVCTPLAK